MSVVAHCVALPSTSAAPVMRAFERLFDEFGVPDAIRSNDGTPFASRAVAGCPGSPPAGATLA